MKKYVFEEYRDAFGIGTATILDDDNEAAIRAQKEWECLSTSDQKSYKTDCAGIFRAYEIEITTEQLEAFDNGSADFSLSDLWTKDIFNAISQTTPIYGE